MSVDDRLKAFDGKYGDSDDDRLTDAEAVPTVAKLIEALKELPQDAEVLVETGGTWGWSTVYDALGPIGTRDRIDRAVVLTLGDAVHD